MKINPIQQNNNNQNFNANLIISGKKILRKNQISELNEMVKNVGSNEDCFFIHVGKLYKIGNNLRRNTIVAHQFETPGIPVSINVTSNFANNRKVLLNPFEQIKEHIQKIINCQHAGCK